MVVWILNNRSLGQRLCRYVIRGYLRTNSQIHLMNGLTQIRLWVHTKFIVMMKLCTMIWLFIREYPCIICSYCVHLATHKDVYTCLTVSWVHSENNVYTRTVSRAYSAQSYEEDHKQTKIHLLHSKSNLLSHSQYFFHDLLGFVSVL